MDTSINLFLASKDAGQPHSSPRVKLTDTLCQKLPTKPYEYEIRDTELRSLRVRVRGSGHKSLEIARKVSGRNLRTRVCVVGDLPLKDVRARGQQLLADMMHGRTATAKRQERAAERAERERQDVTVYQAVEAYIESRDRAPATTAAYVAILNSHLRPWHRKSLVSVTPAMVVELHQSIGGVAANATLRLFRAAYRAQARTLGLEECPTFTLGTSEPGRSWTPEERRERRVHPHQLRAWWQATEAVCSDEERGYLQLLLFTGLRRKEASTLRWDQIDLQACTVTLTAADTKAKRSLVLPLTDSLLTILLDREGEPRPFAGIDETKRLVARVSDRSGVKFSCHDLRRTFATVADEVGIPLPTLKALMNHATPRTSGVDVTLGYIGQVTLARKRKALEAIEAFILTHVAPGHEKDVGSAGRYRRIKR